MKHRTMLIALVILALCTLGAGIAQAQDVQKVNYFANNNATGAPDATVRITNTGQTGGNLCAMIYVFDNDQQLSECCGCITTPDGLRTIPVRTYLTGNPLTGLRSDNGPIKIVSAAVNNSPCDPTGNVTPTATLRAWATHVQNKVGAAFPITETEFLDAPLSAAELASLQADCFFARRLGSGRGICSCGFGD